MEAIEVFQRATDSIIFLTPYSVTGHQTSRWFLKIWGVENRGTRLPQEFYSGKTKFPGGMCVEKVLNLRFFWENNFINRLHLPPDKLCVFWGRCGAVRAEGFF